MAFCFSSLVSFGQNGLEKIIVEKFYISTKADSIASRLDGGILPESSVTYRIYVDMLPDYKFLAAFGNNDHELRFETSTSFFNNEIRGATSPESILFDHDKNNTTLLDSWISVGAACNGYFGVMKTEDDGDGTIVNSDDMLMNTDIALGIPLTQQDGMMAVKSGQTLVGINKLGLDSLYILDAENTSSKGQVFSTYSGTWAALGGIMGPTAENRILIAQLTTDGIFSYQINIQIKKGSLPSEKYVADSPINDERTISTLKGTFTPPAKSPTSDVIIEKENTDIVRIYPNPIKDYLNVEVKSTDSKESTVVYQVFDIVGNELITKQSSGSIDKINVTELPKGFYLLLVTSKNKKIAQKFIKE